VQSNELDRELWAYFNWADDAPLVRLLDRTIRQAEGRAWLVSFLVWAVLIVVGLIVIFILASIMGEQ